MVEIHQRIAQQIAEQNQKRGLTNMLAFSPPDTSAMMKKSAEDRFVGQVRQLIEILVATDHKTDAEKICLQAVAVFDDARLHNAVSDAEEKLQAKQVKPEAAVTTTYPGDWIWEMNSGTLDRVPPILLLRPSTLPTNWVPGDVFGDSRYLSRGRTVQELIARVWSQKNSSLKIVFAANLPADKFDFIVTAQPHWWDSLQAELDRRFHLVEQIENRDGNDLVVVKNANGP
jgi:hypothetical protein